MRSIKLTPSVSRNAGEVEAAYSQIWGLGDVWSNGVSLGDLRPGYRHHRIDCYHESLMAG